MSSFWHAILSFFLNIFSHTPAVAPTPPVNPPVSPAPAPAPTPVPTPQPVPVPATASPRPSGDGNIRVGPTGPTTFGIDVSDFDPDTDWAEVAKAGAEFTLIKATEGITLVNPYFANDWAAAKQNGLLRGAYHLFHPADDPTQAAQAFLDVVGTLGAEDFQPILDWEETDGLDNATQIQNALIWLQAVQAATHKVPIIYVDASFFNALGNPQEFYAYPLWIADYLASQPEIPPPWNGWVMWQYSATGTISGVVNANEADLDYFNGTLAQLQAFIASGNTLPQSS